MTLLDLIPGLKKAASMDGDEWAGPCPYCGGKDRFRVWPNHPKGTGGRFWCRQCKKQGDAIQFLRDKDGLSYRDACATLGAMPSSLSWKPGPPIRPRPAAWTPRPATRPGTVWQEKAASFLAGCQKTLTGPAGSACRAFLTGRGLKPETIRAAGLGWNPGDRFESREAWGLPPEAKENGKPRRVWLPGGLVIPCFAGGQVIRLRVRRPNPEDGPRYVVVSGSGSSPLVLGLGTAPAWVVVESELCGFLLHQEAGDLAGVLGMGNAQARPDLETDRALRAAGLILVSLDTDAAGAREAWGWWTRQYKNVKRWPCPVGKDPTESRQAGLDLRAWVLTAGLPETTTTPAQEAEGWNLRAGGVTNQALAKNALWVEGKVE